MEDEKDYVKSIEFLADGEVRVRFELPGPDGSVVSFQEVLTVDAQDGRIDRTVGSALRQLHSRFLRWASLVEKSSKQYPT